MRRALSILALLALTSVAFTTRAASTNSSRRTIQVSGHGEVDVAPDEALLHMAVQVSNKNLDKAQSRVNAIVRNYLKRAHTLGAHSKDISTAGFSVQPRYDYSSKNGRVFEGYDVTRNIVVTVHDLARIGDFLMQATAAGVNRVSSPVLKSSKAESLRQKALVEAAQNARAKARVLARTLGARLGPVHDIKVNNTPPRPIPVMRTMSVAARKGAKGGNQAMGFSAGQIHYSAEVNVDFDLLNR